MKRTGFTLVELLVSISIIGVLSVIGITSYNQFNRRQILITTVQNLVSELRITQSKAESGERPAGCVGSMTGYKVTFYSGGYKIEANCNSFILIKQVDFPLVVKKTQGCDWLKFKTLREGVETYPPDKKTIVFEAFGLIKTVTIGDAGEISFK